MKQKKLSLILLQNETIQKDALNSYTFARVNLPKSGFAIGMSEVLAFRADHAAARDAIFTPFDIPKIQAAINDIYSECVTIASKAQTKEDYLKRPDLGKLPDSEGVQLLTQNTLKKKDIVIVVTNGLSATAVNENAGPFLSYLIPKLQNANLSLAPLVFVTNGRVAISDTIGEILQAKLSIILVGERPGLSSPNSMSIYFTYAPKEGLTDESRNCISNIRTEGYPIIPAADKLFYLINASLTKKISGVHLKDDMGLTL